MSAHEYGVIILAAGASVRMGKAKQLLPVNGQETLIQHIIKIGQTIDNERITVVLGARHESIRKVIDKQIHCVYNKDWESGMGSSIRCGVNGILAKHPQLTAILILVCDQYFISSKLLLGYKILHLLSINKPKIIAASYDDILGVPALFDQSLFPTLSQLDDEYGARKIIKQYDKQGLVKTIDFSKGAYDMDTPEDYQKVLKMINDENS